MKKCRKQKRKEEPLGCIPDSSFGRGVQASGFALSSHFCYCGASRQASCDPGLHSACCCLQPQGCHSRDKRMVIEAYETSRLTQIQEHKRTMQNPKESSSKKATSCCWPWPWLQGISSPDLKAAERQSPSGSEGQPRGPLELLLHVAAGLLALNPSCVLGLLPQLQRRGEEMAADTNKIHSFFILFIHTESLVLKVY